MVDFKKQSQLFQAAQLALQEAGIKIQNFEKNTTFEIDSNILNNLQKVFENSSDSQSAGYDQCSHTNLSYTRGNRRLTER